MIVMTAIVIHNIIKIFLTNTSEDEVFNMVKEFTDFPYFHILRDNATRRQLSADHRVNYINKGQLLYALTGKFGK